MELLRDANQYEFMRLLKTLVHAERRFSFLSYETIVD